MTTSSLGCGRASKYTKSYSLHEHLENHEPGCQGSIQAGLSDFFQHTVGLLPSTIRFSFLSVTLLLLLLLLLFLLLLLLLLWLCVWVSFEMVL